MNNNPSQRIYSPAPVTLRVSILCAVTLRSTARRRRHEAQEKATGKAVRTVVVWGGMAVEAESLKKKAWPDTRRVHRPESRRRCRPCVFPCLSKCVPMCASVMRGWSGGTEHQRTACRY